MSETPTTNPLPKMVEIYPHVDESQLACWGLGRGIKATEPKRLMQIVARPVPVDEATTSARPCVEETRVGAGYSEVTFCVSSKSELTRQLSATLTVPFAKAVSFECGLCYDKMVAESETKIGAGHLIRNRTYAFRLNAYDDEHRGGDAVPSRLTFVEECIRNEFKARKDDSSARMPELTPEDKEASISACRQAIVGRLGGATHFVASIDMGGKVYREVTTTSTPSKTAYNARFGLTTAAKAASVVAKFRKGKDYAQTTYSENERVILHPNVIGKSLKRDRIIKRDDEVVVCLRVLPIAALVRNPDWSRSMRIASRQFMEGEYQRLPQLVDVTRPFFLKAGTKFFTAHSNGEVGVTEEKVQATPVYIQTLTQRFRSPGKQDLLKTPGAVFLLAFKIDGQSFYLCTSSRDHYRAIALTHVAQTSDGLFSLCHPGSNQPAALQDWRGTALMIKWKCVFFSHRYLNLIPSENRASFLRRHDKTWHKTSGLSQFQLVNEPTTSEDGGSRRDRLYESQHDKRTRSLDLEASI